MDSVTQAVLGATMGEAVLGRKLGWRGAAWGLALGTLPDLDVLFRPLIGDVAGMYWHRGISHSLLACVVFTLLLGWGLPWLAHWKRNHVSLKRSFLFVFLAYSTHIMIDCFTTYGTSVWEPFSDHREWWNLLFIIDPLFTLPMIFGLMASVIFLRKRAFRGLGNLIGLTVSAFYVMFAFSMKLKAHEAFEQAVEGKGRVVATSPTPLNTILWRGLVEDDSFYYIGYWSPFDTDDHIRFDKVRKQRDLLAPFADTPALEAVRWFSRDEYVAAPGREEGEVIFTDMRFGELRLPDENGDIQMTPMFNWTLQKDEHGHTHFGGYRVDRTTLNLPKTIGRIYKRAMGDESDW